MTGSSTTGTGTIGTIGTGSIEATLATARLLVTCGPGGVGKTSTAAALGLAAARAGRKVVVVTIDPARRLADALGIAASSAAEPHRVPGDLDLWALMLDAESTFDRLVIDRAGDRAEAILSNKVYRSIAGSLAGAQEYMAIERLHQLNESGVFDLIIIDTPPSRHAIDILAAPDRLVSFLSHPVYRTLTLPSRSFARVTNAASTAFLWTVKRLAGPQIVEDTIEFFRAMSGMEAGLRQRAAEMSVLLREPSTSFVLVSSPRSEAIDEATYVAGALRDGGFSLGGVVVNLVHPLPPEADFDDGLLAALKPESALAQQIAHHVELSRLAVDERAELTKLQEVAGSASFTVLPLLDHDVHDLDSLAELAALLVASPD